MVEGILDTGRSQEQKCRRSTPRKQQPLGVRYLSHRCIHSCLRVAHGKPKPESEHWPMHGQRDPKMRKCNQIRDGRKWSGRSQESPERCESPSGSREQPPPVSLSAARQGEIHGKEGRGKRHIGGHRVVY